MVQKSGFVAEDGSNFVGHHGSQVDSYTSAESVGDFMSYPSSFIDRGGYASLIVPFLDGDTVVMVQNIDHPDPRLKFPCGEKADEDYDSPLCTAGRESLEEFLSGIRGDGRDWCEFGHHEKLAVMERFVPILADPQRDHVRYVHAILLNDTDELLKMGREPGVREEVSVQSVQDVTANKNGVLWGHIKYMWTARRMLFSEN